MNTVFYVSPDGVVYEPTPDDSAGELDRLSWQQLDLLIQILLWSCREANPALYQGFCLLNCGFVTSRSRSIPLVPCGFVLMS